VGGGVFADELPVLVVNPLDLVDLFENLVSMLKNFFPSSLMSRPDKLEHLSLETLSSQVLEFEGKARADPIGAPFSCFLLE